MSDQPIPAPDFIWPPEPCGNNEPHSAHEFMRGTTAGLCPGAGTNPPGSTSEQLPDDILALLGPRTYLSTACETALLLTKAITRNPARGDLPELRDRMHQRCRRNHKFTGALCSCPCHP
ncbi:hypothetical protein P8A21_03190 [Streptomyces poriferorum]|uniref:Uncharacterized protein n=1 Tax=Streptomyces poriferorum TaxID=2798799 RepID=A0ABY9J1R7_9ACTN|nr:MULTISPECIES: hypothetical protein [unclassified Streptomyces]MDP5309979.1 hypothetical protein [Streptomyces sp. Alt4]WLQ46562.1 hypothetical protein P8A21_03190 [Streptomyces sp. Alt1]WLQ60849.1 hypothetical protein P8A19_37875 [Streptomyces sp. Alt2]